MTHIELTNPASITLSATLILLQRHHRSNRPALNRGTASSSEWRSLWGRLGEIREAGAAGDRERLD